MNEKFKDTDLREALRRNYANVPQLPEGGLTLRPLQGKKELKRRRFPLFWRGIGGLSIAASILIAFLLWPKGDEAPITQPEIQQPVVAKASPVHRREWESAPLCGAGTTFSGSSKDPSRPSQGGVNIAEAHEPQPQQSFHQSHKPSKPQPHKPHNPQQLLAEAQSTPLPERATGVFRGTTECGSGPTKGSELPIRDGGRLGESPLGESLLAEAQSTPLLNREGLGESLQGEGLENLPPERQALVDIYLAEEALQVAYKQQEQIQELRAFRAHLQGKEPETSHLITSF